MDAAKVVVNSSTSGGGWQRVASLRATGLVTGALYYLYQWHGEIWCTFSKLTDDTTEGRDAIQRDLDKPAKWAHKSLMKFKKFKSQELYLGQAPTPDASTDW